MTNKCTQCKSKVDFGKEYICCTDCSDPTIINKGTKLGYCKTGAGFAMQLKPKGMQLYHCIHKRPCVHVGVPGAEGWQVSCLVTHYTVKDQLRHNLINWANLGWIKIEQQRLGFFYQNWELEYLNIWRTSTRKYWSNWESFHLFPCMQRHLSGLWAHGWSVLPHVMVGSATATWAVMEAFLIHQLSTIPWMIAVALRMIWYIFRIQGCIGCHNCHPIAKIWTPLLFFIYFNSEGFLPAPEI